MMIIIIIIIIIIILIIIIIIIIMSYSRRKTPYYLHSGRKFPLLVIESWSSPLLVAMLPVYRGMVWEIFSERRYGWVYGKQSWLFYEFWEACNAIDGLGTMKVTWELVRNLLMKEGSWHAQVGNFLRKLSDATSQPVSCFYPRVHHVARKSTNH